MWNVIKRFTKVNSLQNGPSGDEFYNYFKEKSFPKNNELFECSISLHTTVTFE